MSIPTPPPCSTQPDLWFDDHRAEEAIAICHTCPHTAACRTVHSELPQHQGQWGVWAGTDHHPRTERRRAKAA